MGLKQTNLYDTLSLCTRAGVILKKVGFVHHVTSLKSEATYYRWPGKETLLRVAEHRKKKPYLGLNKISASLTFRGNCLDRNGTIRLADGVFERMVGDAIGRYFIQSLDEISA